MFYYIVAVKIENAVAIINRLYIYYILQIKLVIFLFLNRHQISSITTNGIILFTEMTTNNHKLTSSNLMRVLQHRQCKNLTV